jgi:hypothetical protein
MKFLLVLLFYLLLGAAEAGPLLTRGRRAEAAAAGIITGLGALYTAGILGRWPLPNPALIIELLFRPMAAFLGMS